MITEREKVTDNQKVTVNKTPVDTKVMGDSVYSAEQAATSDTYRNYLEGLLMNEGVAVSEVEYEDAVRYQSVEYQSKAVETEGSVEAVAPVAPVAPAVPAAKKAETETVRVFNQKRAVWLVVYILLAIGVVLALLLTMPGTAWEKKSLTVSTSKMYPVAAASETEVPEVNVNTIYTLSGEKVVVELTPYEEVKPQTNWFDKLCDWLNNAVGG